MALSARQAGGLMADYKLCQAWLMQRAMVHLAISPLSENAGDSANQPLDQR
jgi:hypothetical protein